LFGCIFKRQELLRQEDDRCRRSLAIQRNLEARHDSPGAAPLDIEADGLSGPGDGAVTFLDAKGKTILAEPAVDG